MMQGSLRAQLRVVSGAIGQRRVLVAFRTVVPDAYEKERILCLTSHLFLTAHMSL